MRRFRRCGGVSKGCFLAPAAYLFCAYISIYCTFADRWSYRSVSVEATNSFYHSSKNFGNESSWELLHNLTVDTTVTGVVDKMNQTKIFHTVLIHTNDQPTSNSNDFQPSAGRNTFSVTYYFGLFHVCRHDIGKCFIYSFPETGHLKALFIASSYTLLVLSVSPIVIYQMQFSIKVSNYIQLPLLMLHSVLIIYVLGNYGKHNRARGHELSWTYHISSSLSALPWIVWYWYTLEVAKEASRALEEEADTVTITSNDEGVGLSSSSQRVNENTDFYWTPPSSSNFKPPSYEHVLANQNDYPLVGEVDKFLSDFEMSQRTPPPRYKFSHMDARLLTSGASSSSSLPVEGSSTSTASPHQHANCSRIEECQC
ncbi:uncharacterized protein LOC134845322 [Symsagittifera roscoffensis]|uniref:uncharacterized protein LOC134845322 n=1 Tax=Symsagittifera roscoffensis TaxID=84072 RepID=UPI00307C8216